MSCQADFESQLEKFVRESVRDDCVDGSSSSEELHTSNLLWPHANSIDTFQQYSDVHSPQNKDDQGSLYEEALNDDLKDCLLRCEKREICESSFIDISETGESDMESREVCFDQDSIPETPWVEPVYSQITMSAAVVKRTPIYQRRKGSAHVMGGRKRQLPDEVRRTYVSRCRSLLGYLMSKAFPTPVCFANQLIETLKDDTVCDRSAQFLGTLDDRGRKELLASIGSFLEECSKAKRSGLEMVFSPQIAVVTVFSGYGRQTVRQGMASNARERHVCCTWIDLNGRVRCSCIGSTSFRIHARASNFEHGCCTHALGIKSFLKDIGRMTTTNEFVVGRALNKIIRRTFRGDPKDYDNDLPLFTYNHKDSIAVIARRDSADYENVQFVPIRCIRRTGEHFICAFCDLGRGSGCEHVADLRALIMHGGPILAQGRSQERPKEKPFGFHWNPMEEIECISELPLSIVNCPSSLRVDRAIVTLSAGRSVCHPLSGHDNSTGNALDANDTKPSVANAVPSTTGDEASNQIRREVQDPFLVLAPSRCRHCSAARNESTRELISGTVFCSEGTCAMKLETFDCFKCQAKVHSEGRDHYVLLLNRVTAATHVVLRRLLTGVVRSNGSIKGRCEELHSQFVANQQAKLLPSKQYLRSPRDLQEMCVVMCKLMTISPPRQLFSCGTCTSPDGRLHAVCTDGIWVGYRKTTARRFENIRGDCEAMHVSKTCSTRNAIRPKTGLLRRDIVASILLDAVRGRKLSVTSSNFSAFIAALRIVHDCLVPTELSCESICGRNPSDYNEDTSERTLGSLRRLTSTLFSSKVVSRRLCIALELHMVKIGVQPTRKRNAAGEQVGTIESRALTAMRDFLLTSTELSEVQGICWIVTMPDGRGSCEVSANHCVLKEVFMLYRALVQGPCTHLVTRGQVQSLLSLAMLCDIGKEAVVQALSGGLSLSNGLEQNVLHNSRILRAGLLSASDLCKHNKEVLSNFGSILKSVVRTVQNFYSFYDAPQNVLRRIGSKKNNKSKAGTALEYAVKWRQADIEMLKSSFDGLLRRKGIDVGSAIVPNHYSIACKTGMYFPAHDQVRPLPFNDEMRSSSKKIEKAGSEDVFGICSKNYVQKKHVFTPGALTFCCSCSNPLVMGFKVMERNEGPRSVLDVLVTRFAKMPRHIVYDFGCGLYSSAIHTLWWAIEDTTIVSDAFHAINHNCSPAFHPSSHDNLNMSNTVSHEQRNKPIAELSTSLRAASQELYIALLAFQICIRNLMAKAKATESFEHRDTGISEKDLEWDYFVCLRYVCACCPSPEQ